MYFIMFINLDNKKAASEIPAALDMIM